MAGPACWPMEVTNRKMFLPAEIALMIRPCFPRPSAGGKKPASHVCFMDGCFDEYIVSLKRASTGLVTAQTRLESHCYPGSNCTEEPSKFYTVRCTNPGGYCEYNGQRTPEPELDPPHATQAYKQLWIASCSGMARRSEVYGPLFCHWACKGRSSRSDKAFAVMRGNASHIGVGTIFHVHGQC